MMGARTEPGWYYVGEGQLRYHDEHGWTDHYVDTNDIRGLDWPPPRPGEFPHGATQVPEVITPASSSFRLALREFFGLDARRAKGRHAATR